MGLTNPGQKEACTLKSKTHLMVEPRVKTKVEKKIGETIRCSFPKRQGMK